MRAALLGLALLLAGCARLLPADSHAAEACIERQDLTCAEREYRAFLRSHPDDARRAAMLAMILTREGRHAEALPFYAQAEGAGLRTYDIYASHAQSLDAIGRIDASMRYNRMALALVPQLVDARGRLADQLVSLGRREEALRLLRDFDREGVRWRRPPYFTEQIARIEGKPPHPGPP